MNSVPLRQISVSIGPSPRERKKEKRNDRLECKCRNNPHPPTASTVESEVADSYSFASIFIVFFLRVRVTFSYVTVNPIHRSCLFWQSKIRFCLGTRLGSYQYSAVGKDVIFTCHILQIRTPL